MRVSDVQRGDLPSPIGGNFPFRAGEVLNYRLSWAVFSNAAAVRMSVVEQRDFFGTRVWHFRASARSQLPLRSLAEVDDQFDSYADAATLETKQYETYLSEMGEKENTVSRLVTALQPRPKGSSFVLVRPHTRDPLAALYVLRTIDWSKVTQFEAPVYDGEDMYEMRAQLEVASEEIVAAGRTVEASKISVRLFRGGRESRTRCTLWLSRGAERIPESMEAEVPYGAVRAELVSRSE